MKCLDSAIKEKLKTFDFSVIEKYYEDKLKSSYHFHFPSYCENLSKRVEDIEDKEGIFYKMLKSYETYHGSIALKPFWTDLYDMRPEDFNGKISPTASLKSEKQKQKEVDGWISEIRKSFPLLQKISFCYWNGMKEVEDDLIDHINFKTKKLKEESKEKDKEK